MASDLPPLADLHRHLDGAVRPATLAELAKARGRSVSSTLHSRPGQALEQVLRRLTGVLDLIPGPAEVRRVAAEACEDAAKEGVTTLELRLAPQNHRGAPPEAIVDAALEGIAGRAGLVLCGLHGEPPPVVEALVELAKGRPGVVGLDLAGAPAPGNRWILESYGKAFRRAKELGLGRTVHVAEGRPAEEALWAIDALEATRLGEATTLLEDDDALARVLERHVVIEVGLTWTLHTGQVGSLADHPLAQWLARGLAVTLVTEAPLVLRTDAPAEHRAALKLRGIDRAKLEKIIATGHAAAFRRT